MTCSDRRTNTVDRIAIAAIFTVAMLILVMIEATDQSAAQPLPAAAMAAMVPCVGVHMSDRDRRMPTVPVTSERH